MIFRFDACYIINIAIQTSISIEPGVEVEVTIADAWTFSQISIWLECICCICINRCVQLSTYALKSQNKANFMNSVLVLWNQLM